MLHETMSLLGQLLSLMPATVISTEPIVIYYSTRLFSFYANSVMTAVVTDAKVDLLIMSKGCIYPLYLNILSIPIE